MRIDPIPPQEPIKDIKEPDRPSKPSLPTDERCQELWNQIQLRFQDWVTKVVKDTRK